MTKVRIKVRYQLIIRCYLGSVFRRGLDTVSALFLPCLSESAGGEGRYLLGMV